MKALNNLMRSADMLLVTQPSLGFLSFLHPPLSVLEAFVTAYARNRPR